MVRPNELILNGCFVVYRLFDSSGMLLYIGSTKFLPARLTDHRRSKPWWGEVHRVTWEEYPTERSARQAESTAIVRELPRWNIMGQSRSFVRKFGQPEKRCPNVSAGS